MCKRKTYEYELDNVRITVSFLLERMRNLCNSGESTQEFEHSVSTDRKRSPGAEPHGRGRWVTALDGTRIDACGYHILGYFSGIFRYHGN